MKKIFAVALMVSLLAFGGCSTDTTEVTESSSEVTSEATSEATPEENTDETAEVEEFSMVMLDGPQEGQDIATIETSMGDMTVMLFPEYAPKAVENFLTHAEEGYYDGLIFHRVMEDFMIQGGDPNGTGTGGESIWGAPFEDEFHQEMRHIKGALSMANSGSNTNGSQFFIVSNSNLAEGYADAMVDAEWPEELITAYEERGGTPWLDGAHTVFGFVYEGLDVLEAIEKVEVDGTTPVEDVVINTITVSTYTAE